MPINIHGKEYVTVAERVKAVHETEKKVSITTELLRDDPVVIRATVTTEKGVFTGTSYANTDKAIEDKSPYEVAETSAVGRALGFAGYGLTDDIASADEMYKAGVKPTYSEVKKFATEKVEKMNENVKPTLKQMEAVVKISEMKGEPITFEEVSSWGWKQASDYIGNRGNGGYYKNVKKA